MNDKRINLDSLENSRSMILEFTKTLGYKQLTDDEQKMTKDILENLIDFMDIIHHQSIYTWKSEDLLQVLIYVFPETILANRLFFQSIPKICKKFFEFLYFIKHIHQASDWIFLTKEVNQKIISIYDEVLQANPEEKSFLKLGEELGLDMSRLEDIDNLYFLYSYCKVVL